MINVDLMVNSFFLARQVLRFLHLCFTLLSVDLPAQVITVLPLLVRISQPKLMLLMLVLLGIDLDQGMPFVKLTVWKRRVVTLIVVEKSLNLFFFMLQGFLDTEGLKLQRVDN